MPGGDNDNWSEGRCVLPYNSIIKDANVVVSNGSVKLQVKKEPSSWHCDTCTMDTLYKNYSSATLNTRYTKSFNAGKFEARIKMPTFLYAHATFWTWMGNIVDEIDIAEAYGWTGSSGLFGYYPKNGYSLHAWEPGNTTITNPYGMQHVEVHNRFERQTWWDWMRGKYFRQQDYHIYTCEWDTALVRFYLDGGLISEQWKYYQERDYTTGWWFWQKTHHYKVGSTCNPGSGTWHIMQGFPYNDTSASQLRFDCAIDNESSKHDNGLLGEMEIDYVKMWQRHPANGWTNICNPAPGAITGPNIVCNTATFSVVPPSPSGYWMTPSANLSVVSSNNASITVQKNPTSNTFDGYVYYYPLDPNCPNTGGYALQWKRVDVGLPVLSGVVCVAATNTSNYGLHYNLLAQPLTNGLTNPSSQKYFSATTFEWDVDYGPGLSLHYHGYGQYVSTPTITYSPQTNNTVSWTVKITNACGTVIKTGRMNYYLRKKAPDQFSDSNPDNLYAFADVVDLESYDSAVTHRVSELFLPENADSVTINSAIEKIAAEELAPYIILDSTDVQQINAERKIKTNTASQTSYYPNPTTGMVNFTLSNKYMQAPVDIEVYDMLGSLRKRRCVFYNSGDLVYLDLSEMGTGIYVVKLRQLNNFEQFRIVKR